MQGPIDNVYVIKLTCLITKRRLFYLSKSVNNHSNAFFLKLAWGGSVTTAACFIIASSCVFTFSMDCCLYINIFLLSFSLTVTIKAWRRVNKTSGRPSFNESMNHNTVCRTAPVNLLGPLDVNWGKTGVLMCILDELRATYE